MIPSEKVRAPMDYGIDTELRKEYRQEKREAADQAARDFSAAARLASEHGLVLTRCTQDHYHLRAFEDGCVCWLYNLYPGKCRIWPDPHHRGPFLRVPAPWTLVDVVRAVADRLSDRDAAR